MCWLEVGVDDFFFHIVVDVWVVRVLSFSPLCGRIMFVDKKSEGKEVKRRDMT